MEIDLTAEAPPPPPPPQKKKAKKRKAAAAPADDAGWVGGAVGFHDDQDTPSSKRSRPDPLLSTEPVDLSSHFVRFLREMDKTFAKARGKEANELRAQRISAFMRRWAMFVAFVTGISSWFEDDVESMTALAHVVRLHVEKTQRAVKRTKERNGQAAAATS